MNVYNEIDPFPAAWLTELIHHDLIAPGRVDGRSIADLGPGDVAGPGQRHFFAGIGIWSAALRMASWPDDADVWTGSCPCQPFSDAGRKRGTSDARHLWPEWRRLIAKCLPPVILGEQVASKAGRAWLGNVRADLEALGYAVGASDLPAASVGAPHMRQRLFFVAHRPGHKRGLHLPEREPRRAYAQAERGSEARSVADSDGARLEIVSEQQARRQRETTERGGPAGQLADSEECRRSEWSASERRENREDRPRPADGGQLGDTSSARSRRDTGGVPRTQASGDCEWVAARRFADVAVPAGATRGHWTDTDWLLCRDSKARPVEPGTFPLAHGYPARMGRLRAYGNAIVVQLAAEFIIAATEAIEASDRI